jgi:hypothetical protein
MKFNPDMSLNELRRRVREPDKNEADSAPPPARRPEIRRPGEEHGED